MPAFKGLPTDPSCIDIGGLQVGFSLGASAIGGRFITVGAVKIHPLILRRVVIQQLLVVRNALKQGHASGEPK